MALLPEQWVRSWHQVQVMLVAGLGGVVMLVVGGVASDGRSRDVLGGCVCIAEVWWGGSLSMLFLGWHGRPGGKWEGLSRSCCTFILLLGDQDL